MGFRLSSAIAGFADRTSENLTALQNKADEITKTAAERYANEALQVRKERIKSVREYTRAAKELKQMGLNNAQIEVALSAGVAGVENVKSSLENLEKREKLKDISFEGFNTLEERKGAINSLFTGLPENATGRDIAEQAKIFASFESPMVAPDAKARGEQVAASTKTLFSPKGIDPEYTTAQFTAQAEAAGGKAPVDVEGDLGVAGATMRTVSDPVGLINALQVQATLDRSNIEIEGLKLANEQATRMNPLLVTQLKEAIETGKVNRENIQVDTLLKKAQKAHKDLEMENYKTYGADRLKAELENTRASTAKIVAETGRPDSYEQFIVGMQFEISRLDPTKDADKIAVLKKEIATANLNYTAFELVGESGDINIEGLGTMKGMLSEIVKQNALGKFALGKDFIIVPNVAGTPGEETIKWIGSKEGKDEFDRIRKQSKRELINALAPNGKYVNDGARITIQAFAPNEYAAIYPTEGQLYNQIVREFKNEATTTIMPLNEMTQMVLRKLQFNDSTATEEDALKLIREAKLNATGQGIE